MNWIFENWKEVGTVILAFLGAFSILAKLTPWDWDNKAIGKITKLIRFIGLVKKKTED